MCGGFTRHHACLALQGLGVANEERMVYAEVGYIITTNVEVRIIEWSGNPKH